MFNNLFSRIGGIFSPAEKTKEVKTVDSSMVDVYSARNPQSPKEVATEAPTSIINLIQSTPMSPLETKMGEIVTEDVADFQLFVKPIKRYGRICDCPKDPTYSMFC